MVKTVLPFVATTMIRVPFASKITNAKNVFVPSHAGIYFIQIALYLG